MSARAIRLVLTECWYKCRRGEGLCRGVRERGKEGGREGDREKETEWMRARVRPYDFLFAALPAYDPSPPHRARTLAHRARVQVPLLPDTDTVLVDSARAVRVTEYVFAQVPRRRRCRCRRHPYFR